MNTTVDNQHHRARKPLRMWLLIPPLFVVIFASAHSVPAWQTGTAANQTQIPPQTQGKPAANSSASPCLPSAEAASLQGKDACFQLHVYDVVELAGGLRFLDVCPADVADDQCRFTLVSLPADRDDVGDLRRYRDLDITVRGVVRSLHGRLGILISHQRQFHGGPEKFRPNPRLLRGFQADADRPPVRDPNLTGGGRRRSFMNSSDREPLPAKHP